VSGTGSTATLTFLSATHRLRAPTSSDSRRLPIPSAYDFILSGSQEAARNAAFEALTGAGFSVAPSPDGNAVAIRGSLSKTLLLGAMAGKNFHVQFPVAFYSDPEGNLIVRLTRNAAAGMKGGAIGIGLTNNAFVATIEKLLQHFQSLGIFVTSIAHE
jgi:hypothetical protein